MGQNQCADQISSASCQIQIYYNAVIDSTQTVGVLLARGGLSEQAMFI